MLRVSAIICVAVAAYAAVNVRGASQATPDVAVVGAFSAPNTNTTDNTCDPLILNLEGELNEWSNRFVQKRSDGLYSVWLHLPSLVFEQCKRSIVTKTLIACAASIANEDGFVQSLAQDCFNAWNPDVRNCSINVLLM